MSRRGGAGVASRHRRHQGRRKGQRRRVVRQHFRDRPGARRRATVRGPGAARRPRACSAARSATTASPSSPSAKAWSLRARSKATAPPLHTLVAAMLAAGARHPLHARSHARRRFPAPERNRGAVQGRESTLEERRDSRPRRGAGRVRDAGARPALCRERRASWLRSSTPGDAEELVDAMRGNPLGREAQIIGTVTETHPGLVTMRTTWALRASWICWRATSCRASAEDAHARNGHRQFGTGRGARGSRSDCPGSARAQGRRARRRTGRRGSRLVAFLLRSAGARTEFEPLALEIEYRPRRHRCRACGGLSRVDYDFAMSRMRELRHRLHRRRRTGTCIPGSGGA